MATITANTGSNPWNTNGAWVGSVQPTAADDVVIPASATVTIPASTTALGRSLTVQASGTIAFAATSSTLTLGDGTAGAGNVALSVSSSATVTLTGIGTINFVSTSATVQTIDSGGKTLPTLTFNATSNGSWQFAANLTSSGAVNLTKGTLDMNSKTVVLTALNMSGANARTLTLGSASISSSGGNLLGASGSNITITANTATFTWNPQGTPQANGGGVNWNGASIVVQDASGSAFQFTSPGTWANFTYNGAASKNGSLAFYTAGPTVTGTFTVTGNSATNRVLVQSDTLGTARTITAAAVSLTNVDFMDTTGAGAATWSGTSIGDCLGNSGITFTTNSGTARDGGGAGVKRYAVAAGNWSSTATWSETSGGSGGASVPLPQDDVYLNASSAAGTYTQDMLRCGRNIDCTGFTRTLSWGVSSIYGSFTLASGMTFSQASTLTCAGRGSHTFTSAGKSFGSNLIFTAPGGTYTLLDANTGVGNWAVTAGTFDSGGFNISGWNLWAITGSLTRSVNFQSSTLTLSQGLGIQGWQVSGANYSLSAASATFVISTASAQTRTLVMGGNTYGTLRYTVANSPGTLVITGANTFGTLDIGPGRTLSLPASTTTTVTNPILNGTVNGYWRSPNTSGHGATSPDSAALSITGDITIDVKVALDDWTPSSTNELVAKYQDAGKVTYAFYVGTDGKLWLSTSSNGSTFNTNTSSAATGITDGAVKWVRGCLDVDNGSSQRVARFYTSDDGSSWTQLGTTVTTAGATSIIDTTAQLEIGSDFNLQSNRASGNFYRVRIYNSDLGSGSGTPVFDADFTTKPVGTNSFVESSANAATVTFTGDVAKAGDGRLAIVSGTPGTKATLAKAGGGQVWCDRATFTDITGSPTDAWYSDYPLSSVTAVAPIPRQAVML